MKRRQQKPNCVRLSAWLSRVALLMLLLSVSVGASLFLPSIVAAQSGAFEAATSRLKGDYDALKRGLEVLLEARGRLESRHAAIAAKVAKEKTSGGVLGLRLESLLEEGKVLSEQLYTLQEKIRSEESRLTVTRRELLKRYDAEISLTQREVLTPSAEGSRSSAIARLNTLSRARHRYVVDVKVTPDLNLSTLSALNVDSPVLQDPEDALSLAAELDDADQKLKRHIEGLTSQLEELRQRKRTRSKAKNFREEENFFDDATPGGRRVARSGSGDRSQIGTDSGKPTSVAMNSEATSAPQSSVSDNSDSADSVPPMGGSEGVASTDDAPLDSDNENSGGNSFADPDERATPPVATVTGEADTLPRGVPITASPADPFGVGGDVIRGGVGANVASGSGAPTDGESLEQTILRLKREKRRAEQKSRQVRERSKELKKLADTL